MLTPMNNRFINNVSETEEGYHEGTLTIELNSREFDVYELILQLTKEGRGKGKT
jgi:hypothetical protein